MNLMEINATMSNLNEELITEITKIINSAEGNSVKVELIGHKDIQIEQIDDFIESEVYKATTFYLSKNKINLEQAIEVNQCAVAKLKSEMVTSEYKIKHVVKDYIIHILSRDLQSALRRLQI